MEPDNWPQIQSLLEKNSLRSIKIKLVDYKPKHPLQSKFGGKPYWPKNKSYPTDKEGNPLNFIAQINFSEITETLEDYPRKGLLQFFIANDGLYGLDFFDDKNTLENSLINKKNYAVIYHSEFSEPINEFSKDIEAALNNDDSPYSGESSITFTLSDDLVSPFDYRFNKITRPLGELDDDIEEYACKELYKSPNHKMGGYAYFTQEDPRVRHAPDGNWLLLFQMDSDSNERIDIMWGDVGIANFFIRPEDLKNLNFNNVWYNWDCS